MTFSRSLIRQSLAYFTLFTSSVFATLLNVTVDDAVLTGPVVPQYLPSALPWNVGNNCSMCLAKPDPSHAYNGTWHDATFHPGTGFSQAVEFTFTGSALYIFFILANNIAACTGTLTDVSFSLDGAIASTFVHPPSSGADYQYNVPVYVNDSLALGQHSMMIEPINSGNEVLMLFDYLIYTTDTDNATTSGAASTSTPAFPPSPSTLSHSGSSLSPSQTSSVTKSTASGQHDAAIIGGAVGGVAAFVVASASLVYYWRYKRRGHSLLPLARADGEAVLASPVAHREVAPMAPGHAFQSVHQMMPLIQERRSIRKWPASLIILRPPSPPPSVSNSSTPTASLVGNNLHEQARDQVPHLHSQNYDRTSAGLQSAEPPRYSYGQHGRPRR